VAAAGGVPVQLHYPSPGRILRRFARSGRRGGGGQRHLGRLFVERADLFRGLVGGDGGGTLYVSYGGLDVDGFVRCVGQVDTPKLAAMGQIVMDLCAMLRCM
jgi:hypothetical protein